MAHPRRPNPPPPTQYHDIKGLVLATAFRFNASFGGITRYFMPWTLQMFNSAARRKKSPSISTSPAKPPGRVTVVRGNSKGWGNLQEPFDANLFFEDRKRETIGSSGVGSHSRDSPPNQPCKQKNAATLHL